MLGPMAAIAAFFAPVIELPPVMYQGDTLATVIFTADPMDPRLCGYTPGMVTFACTFPSKRLIVMPNPCMVKGDLYADLLCHEIGHVNLWDHGSRPTVTMGD